MSTADLRPLTFAEQEIVGEPINVITIRTPFVCPDWLFGHQIVKEVRFDGTGRVLNTGSHFCSKRQNGKYKTLDQNAEII